MPVVILATESFNESLGMVFAALGMIIVGLLWPIILVVLVIAAGMAIVWAIAGIYELVKWIVCQISWHWWLKHNSESKPKVKE